MDYKIRDIYESDLDSLATLFVSAFKPEDTGEYWDYKSAHALMKYWYKRSPDRLKILATDDLGNIVGGFFADIKPWWDGARLIDGEFFVHTPHQRQGIGSMLLKETLIRAKEYYNAVCYEAITFEPDTKHPLSWYSKIGFKRQSDLLVINGNIDCVLENLE